jgi:hypothetical protein
MAAGRPRIVDPQELYFFAQEYYWDFRGLAEGRFRLGFDKQKFDKAIADSEKVTLSDEDRARLKDLAQKEVREGRLEEVQKQQWLQNLEEDHLWMERENRRNVASEEARKRRRVPGEPDVLNALLRAQTPEQVREICKDAFVPVTVEIRPGTYKEVELANWPIPSGNGSMFPRYLSQYAEQFVAAKNDPRFPDSGRPTSLRKQLWFLARALAGAVMGIQTRTAINLVGSKRPEQVFEESRAAKPERTRTKAKGRR